MFQTTPREAKSLIVSPKPWTLDAEPSRVAPCHFVGKVEHVLPCRLGGGFVHCTRRGGVGPNNVFHLVLLTVAVLCVSTLVYCLEHLFNDVAAALLGRSRNLVSADNHSPSRVFRESPQDALHSFHALMTSTDPGCCHSQPPQHPTHYILWVGSVNAFCPPFRLTCHLGMRVPRTLEQAPCKMHIHEGLM